MSNEFTTVRRSTALLDSIPINQRSLVYLRDKDTDKIPESSRHNFGIRAQFNKVDTSVNIANFSVGLDQLDLPIDRIESVWLERSADESLRWVVSVGGILRHANGEWVYWPEVKK